MQYNENIMKKIIMAALMLLFLCSLSATVTATYTTYPLHFQTFTNYHNVTCGGIGTNHYPDKMAVHLGRYVINTGSDTVRNLKLTTNNSSQIYFEGHTNWNPNRIDRVGFRVVTILHYNSQTTAGHIDWGGGINPINPINTPMTGQIIVDFLLVSYNEATVFIPNETYTHVSGSIGVFDVSFSTSESDFNSAPYTPMVDPGGDPIPTQPYLDGGTIVPEEDVPYGDPPDNVVLTFTILNEQSFELHKAYSGLSTEVATAQITLTKVPPNKTYGVILTFTNATNTAPFRMRLQESMPNPPTIEYRLRFNNQVLDPGDSAAWENLTNGTFTKNIEVTGINPTVGQACLSGSYRDTVYVTIVPIDSQ